MGDGHRLGVELSILPLEYEEATAAAKGRQDYAERNHLKQHGIINATPDQRRLADIVGCLGELKTAQYFGLKFEPNVGVIDGIDCEVLNVRTRNVETGRDLAIRPRDKMRCPVVLCWFERERGTLTIVGWLVAWEAHARAMAAKQAARGHDVMWQPTRKVWFVPGPYHSIASLQDWILCGAPQHWAPAEYLSPAGAPQIGEQILT